jgi:hypothetical protein
MGIFFSRLRCRPFLRAYPGLLVRQDDRPLVALRECQSSENRWGEKAVAPPE